MAIEAGERVTDELGGLLERHLADGIRSRHELGWPFGLVSGSSSDPGAPFSSAASR
jgi:hypothetical protein